MDVLPTLAKLANVPLPANVVYDGRDMSSVLFDEAGGKSQHEVLFFYGGAKCPGWKGPSAARMGAFKAHFATGPGLSGCAGCDPVCYCDDPTGDGGTCSPLIFNVLEDPSEAYPLTDPEVTAKFVAALQEERRTFTYGKLVAPPDEPGEGPNKYGVCCDRKESGTCDCSGPL